MSLATLFLLLGVILSLALQASSRPQSLNTDAEGLEEEFVVPSHKLGFIIGDITVFSDHVNVDRPKKKSKQDSPPPEETKGPRTLSLVAGPEGGEVGVAAESPGISISGASITFNRPAEVVPVSTR
ncbi:uncharacterized protein LOC122257680 [Penaeus japonicus]|uniref:uncharacterized protein LOC122257680 n=1 Tax=Penaeus japonicus TaxID=27405 RepID=UPI001C70F063|nr:uncharacterized protein LOC122257680 [Penaeus japonicus]